MKIVNQFEGATHFSKATGEAVKATHWKKDGAHPLVERYPIERRGIKWKGILVVGPKEKFALEFGDWVVEDIDGRICVVSGQPQLVTTEQPVVGAAEGTFVRSSAMGPSDFDQRFAPLEAAK